MRKVSNFLEYELGLESISRLGESKYLEHLVYLVICYHLSFNIFMFYHVCQRESFFPAPMSQKCMQPQKTGASKQKVWSLNTYFQPRKVYNPSIIVRLCSLGILQISSTSLVGLLGALKTKKLKDLHGQLKLEQVFLL